MLTIKERKNARFRIQIYDLLNKKSRTISLENHTTLTVDDIKERVRSCFTKK